MEYLCTECGKTYPSSEVIWQCTCGGLLDIIHEFRFEPDMVRNRYYSMWRYREALPVIKNTAIISFGEGYTPLVPVDFGVNTVFIKQDHLFPTGSYKDRGASVLVSKAFELGINHVVEDSSGNAGSAIAAYCANASIQCDIYVPEATSPNKLKQIRSYGAHLHPVKGDRSAAAGAVLEAAENTFYASHSYNPLFFHGTKTFAYEVCEQLGWKAPDTVILPIGNGTLFLGAFIGFRELKEQGIINTLPVMIGVQSAACAPVYRDYITLHMGNLLKTGVNYKIDDSESCLPTIAEGIAISNPVRKKQILTAVAATGGSVITVDDEEIVQSLKRIHQKGYYIEPTSGAVTAGIEKYCMTAKENECIVSAFTGHGLKHG